MKPKPYHTTPRVAKTGEAYNLGASCGEKFVNPRYTKCMPRPDHIVRVTSRDLNVRAACVNATATCEEARRRHQSSPLASVALGRTMSAALLLGATLKDQQRVGVQFKGTGPLREVYADSDGAGNVRGYVLRPEAEVPLREGRLDISKGLGAGVVSVTTDLGMRDVYQGVVELVDGEMSQDIAHYLLSSAQIPSIVELGVHMADDGSIAGAGGFLVQVLPGENEGALRKLEGNILGLPPASVVAKEGLEPLDILERVFSGFDIEVVAEDPVAYQCRCSRERVERTLIALGCDELESMVAENHGAEVKCEFCAEFYRFTEDELQELIQQAAE